MTELLTKDGIEYLISRLLENANEATSQSRKDRKDEFAAGRQLAYYEMLDILKSELSIMDQDLEELGLNIDLEKEFI